MANDDLSAPQTQEEINALIGPQGDHPILRSLGMAVLSMVAIHYGSYALKNAGATLLKKYASDITFASGRATSIAEDVLGLGKKLDAYSTRQLGLITDKTPLGEEFILRAKARAAKQAKRFPFEFIPAYLVETTMQPKIETDDQKGYHLKTMGRTVLFYAGADIVIGPLGPILAKTQAAKIARDNLRRVGPDALKWMEQTLNPYIIKGSGGAEAIGRMYREWEKLPAKNRVPTAHNMRTLWRTTGKPAYEEEVSALRAKVHDDTLPSVLKVLSGLVVRQGDAAKAGKDAAYMEDWVDNLMSESASRARPLTREQAESLFYTINIGQDKRVAFRPIGVGGDIIGENTQWYSRFGHNKDTFKFNFAEMKVLIKRDVPQLTNFTDEDLHGLFQRTTERTDSVTRSTWISPGAVGNRASRSGTGLPGGVLQQHELYQTYAALVEQFGKLDPTDMAKNVNRLGVRKITLREMGQILEQSQSTSRGRALFKHFQEIDEMLKAAGGGEQGTFYQQWQNLFVDNAMFIPGTQRIGTTSVIDFTLLQNKAVNVLTKLEGYTKIPILGFNPLQLINWRSRISTPESRWVPIGSYHRPLGGIVTTPTFQIGERISQWEGVRVGGNYVSGRMRLRPERFKAYDTSLTTSMGRMVRNVSGLGDDVRMQFPEEEAKPRFFYRRFPRIANALDISPTKQGSIASTVINWARGAPAYALSQKLKGRFPNLSRAIYSRIEDIYFPKELKDIMDMGAAAPPEKIVSALTQAANMFHPGLPPHILRRAAEWLPRQHTEATFYKLGAGRIREAIPEVSTLSLIQDVVEGRENLGQILRLLHEDALALQSTGSSTISLYRSLLRKHTREISRNRRALSMALPETAFGAGEFTYADKVKRDIISYLLVRPTTVSTVRAAHNAPLQTLMQVRELDDIATRIGALGPQGKAIKNQISGAIASMKLSGYRANYAGKAAARMEAIRTDPTIIGEMNALIKDWAQFPRGRGWRHTSPSKRNATVVLNRFADEFTYLETFRSAWKRDPAAAVAGIMGGGGTKTGISLGAYHIVNRLRAVLKLVGLDFKEGVYTNPLDMLVGGFIFKRILPAMAVIEAYKWLDWQFSKLGEDSETGGLTATMMKWGLVKPTVAGARLGEIFGVQEAAKWFGKVTGEEDRMNALKYMTMSAQEMQTFWEQGEVPIRRGRWWILSPTPFEGQRTQFFAPNVYRRVQSRHQYTWEGGRGPEEFAFARSWLPNPSYPLAPLRRVFDPYAFEKATYNLRPYAQTGDFFTGPYGPITPILNATIGQLIKPTRQMHPEYQGALAAGVSPYGGAIEGVRWPTAGTGIGTGMGSQLVHSQMAAANVRVMNQAQTGSATVGQPYGIGTEATVMLMGQVGVGPTELMASTPPGIWTTPSAIGSMAETAYRYQEMAGIYGFGVQAVRTRFGLSPEYQPTSYIPKASEAYSFQSRFWGMNLGGMGDWVLPKQSEISNITFSEIFRRFVPGPPKSQKVEYIPNTLWQQNPWLPGPYSGYFEDFSVGDPYARPFGDFMLPGEVYMRTYGTMPRPEKGMAPYGPIDRLRILSKVAPWSLEYKALNRSVARMDLTPSERVAYETIRAQVEEINQKYEFAPYRFKGLTLEERSYEILGVTPEGYLQARGLGTPIKLAGLQPGTALAEALSGRVEGQRLNLQIDLNRPRFNYENEQRVLEAVSGNLNKDLIEQGLAEEIGGSPLSYYARTNAAERLIGSAWESITHTWNPITTKFIQRRTALEEYERTNVYGLQYAPWTHPYSSFIRPQFESAEPKSWYGTIAWSALVGRTMGRGKMASTILGTLGGVGGALNKGLIEAREFVTGETWVPGHVKERWEQQEYMDILQYVAAAKNYSLYRRRALSAGEQDPESLWLKDQSSRAWQSRQKKNISASILERSVYGGVSRKAWEAQNPIGAQALAWREKMGQTLYGANLTGDYLALQQAIPKERRMYFEQFLNAPQEDRERILSLLPRLERRVYESAWGLPVEPKPNLTDYFQNNFLPGPEAVIWNTNVDWDKAKVRMIEKAGGNPSEYGYYPQEVAAAELYPIPVPTPDMSRVQDIKSMLEQILGGDNTLQGLAIEVVPTSEPGFSMDFNVTRDVMPIYNSMIGDSLRGM